MLISDIVKKVKACESFNARETRIITELLNLLDMQSASDYVKATNEVFFTLIQLNPDKDGEGTVHAGDIYEMCYPLKVINNTFSKIRYAELEETEAVLKEYNNRIKNIGEILRKASDEDGRDLIVDEIKRMPETETIIKNYIY